MNDLPRRRLIQIIALWGAGISDDPPRLEGLLWDSCGTYKREIHALMDACRERVPVHLRSGINGIPPALQMAGLTKRLVDACPISEDMAAWAVESWALALGVISNSPPTAPAVKQSPPVIQSSPAAVPPAHPLGVVSPPPTFEPLMVPVAAGEFLMGSTPQQAAQALTSGMRDHLVRCELPQHSVWVAEYAIGKYPVTCHEYHAFVQEAGYAPPAGWNLRKYANGKWNHPVVNISLADARAYCTWLSTKTGKRYRLPKETEWEKAARGTDGRTYPWGEVFEPDRANTREANPSGTTPVDQFSPQGNSPYGCADMAGNIWEWCDDGYDGQGYPVGGANPPRHLGYWVCRGGSWRDPAYAARCAVRHGILPDYALSFVGFRVVMAV